MANEASRASEAKVDDGSSSASIVRGSIDQVAVQEGARDGRDIASGGCVRPEGDGASALVAPDDGSKEYIEEEYEPSGVT